MAARDITTQAEASKPVALGSATQDELKAHLRLLFSAFRTADSENSDQIAATYLLVLKQYSVQAIRAGVMKLIDGRIPEHEGTWLPSCAIVARAVRAEDEKIRTRLELKWGRRVSGWRAIGHWEEAWGPEPFKPGCECPDFMLADDFKPQDSLRLLEKLA